jgi:hypothetical protein
LTFTDAQGQKTRQHIAHPDFVDIISETACEAVGAGAGLYSDWFDRPDLKHMIPLVEKGPRDFMKVYLDRPSDFDAYPAEPGTPETCNFLRDAANSENRDEWKGMLKGSFDEYFACNLSVSQFFMRGYGIFCLLGVTESGFNTLRLFINKRPASQSQGNEIWTNLISELHRCMRELDNAHREIDVLFDF